MSYILIALCELYGHTKEILTNPSLSQFKGAMRNWESDRGPKDYTSWARYVVHDGKLHIASAGNKTHVQIAQEVSGEKDPSYKGGWIDHNDMAKLKTTKDLYHHVHNNWTYEYSGGSVTHREAMGVLGHAA